MIYVSSHNITLYIISNFFVLKGTHVPLILKWQNMGEKIEELIHPRGNVRRRLQNWDTEDQDFMERSEIDQHKSTFQMTDNVMMNEGALQQQIIKKRF